MSNALAIATITAVLKDLLENGLVKDSIITSVGDVIVTALSPDRISVETDARVQLNLFLYQVTQNRNADWVSRELRSDRSRLMGEPRSTNPPLAVDLHYLLTAYGAKDFQTELLLGYAMQLLHETPVLTRDIIHTALKNVSTVNTSSILSQALADLSVSALADQIGQIKVWPEFLDMEQTSKLWSALQTHYRPSAAYQASMVIIDSRSLNKPVEPSVIPFSQPLVEQVIAPAEVGQLIFAGSTLVIRGKRLRSDLTRIRLSGSETLLVPQEIQETQISLPLPANLYAGVQSLQVVHTMMRTAGMSQHQVESNVVAFVLQPKIVASVERVQGSDQELRSANILVKFSPKVNKTQRVVLLLNEVTSGGALAYSFAVALRTDDTDSLAIPIKDVQAGTYFVRVQVDGAQSPLRMNQAGEYDSPQVTIP